MMFDSPIFTMKETPSLPWRTVKSGETISLSRYMLPSHRQATSVIVTPSPRALLPEQPMCSDRMRQKTTSRLPAHLSLQHSSVQILHPKAFSPVSIIITTSALSHQPRVRHQLLPHTRVLFKDTMNHTSTELIALKSPMTKNASLVFFLHTATKIIILLAIVDVLRVLLRQVQVYLDQHGHEHHEIHGPQRVRLVRRRRRRFDDDVLGFPF